MKIWKNDKRIDTKEKTIKCTCGCTALNLIDYLDYDDIPDNDQVEIIFSSNYLDKENGKWRAIKEILKNRDICYAGVMLTREDAIKFFEDCAQFLRENKEEHE